MPKTLSIILSIAIILFFTCYAFWGLDWGSFSQALNAYSLFGVFCLLLCSFIPFIPMAFRLGILMENRFSFLSSLNASILSFGINNIAPAKAGELAKAYYINKQTNVPFSKALSIVFWERFFDLNFLLVLTAVAARICKSTIGLFYFSLVLVACLWLGVMLCVFFSQALYKITSMIPWKKFRNFINTTIHHISILPPKRTAFFTFTYTALYFFINYIFIAVALLWIGDFNVSYSQILIVFIVLSLGSALGASPGSLGIFEGTFVLSMGWFGINRSESLALGIVLHAVIFFPPILVSLLIMAKSNLSLRAIQHHDNTGECEAELAAVPQTTKE